MVSWTAPVTPDLRCAAEYHEGRKLTDHEVVDVLQQAVAAVLAHWAAVGAWVTHMENWNPVIRPKLSGIAVNNPSQEARQRRSIAMKTVWAEKRRQGIRLPALPPQFESRWWTPERKAHQSMKMRQAWEKRRLEVKEA
jgi:hypothetical protein